MVISFWNLEKKDLLLNGDKFLKLGKKWTLALKNGPQTKIQVEMWWRVFELFSMKFGKFPPKSRNMQSIFYIFNCEEIHKKHKVCARKIHPSIVL
jgi:hypothetical protein